MQNCKLCNQPFYPSRSNQIYCSNCQGKSTYYKKRKLKIKYFFSNRKYRDTHKNKIKEIQRRIRATYSLEYLSELGKQHYIKKNLL